MIEENNSLYPSYIAIRVRLLRHKRVAVDLIRFVHELEIKPVKSVTKHNNTTYYILTVYILTLISVSCFMIHESRKKNLQLF